MERKSLLIIIVLVFFAFNHAIKAQRTDSASPGLYFKVPLMEGPQNWESPYHLPSMNQSTEITHLFFQTGFWGIDKLTDKIIPVNRDRKFIAKAGNGISNYALGFLFAKYSSMLPLPFGEWQHEEFHRSVLSVYDINSKNGMWLFHRWDGTVYGISDEKLSSLKTKHLEGLLYSYTAGVHAELIATKISLVYSFEKNLKTRMDALYLYNAWYVYNYFRFSTSPATDSVKKLAPRHESKNPADRDFAGADLTAWAYDMFQPDLPYASRTPFPEGDGVNRRVAFSELPGEAQDFLRKQKTLSLLNFLNPSILGIHRFQLSENISFLPFVQYFPTHFGNGLSLNFPVKIRNNSYFLALHNYNNRNLHLPGIEIESPFLALAGSEKHQLRTGVQIWKQPGNQSYFDASSAFGGKISAKYHYRISKNAGCYLSVLAKTKGWVAGNPYLGQKVLMDAGIDLNF